MNNLNNFVAGVILFWLIVGFVKLSGMIILWSTWTWIPIVYRILLVASIVAGIICICLDP